MVMSWAFNHAFNRPATMASPEPASKKAEPAKPALSAAPAKPAADPAQCAQISKSGTNNSEQK